MKILNTINDPCDLKKFNSEELDVLCKEIREFTVETVMKSGGHLASNLGVTELTVALLKTFDLPTDKIIYDVGHQSYVHKMLTGRIDKFDSLRCLNGLSGFPKTSESEYDSFNTGHASTSVSAALGMARARDLNNDDYHVVAVIGDGALTGGMAFEGLNDAGSSHTKLIIVLNDNEMSIEKNVGALSKYLSKIRTAPRYGKTKDGVHDFLSKFGKFGAKIERGLKGVKDSIKYAYTSGALFEFLGLTYLGISDGNDISQLCNVFERAKKIDGPVLIHVSTKKGLGYTEAEDNPEKFHGVSRECTHDKNDLLTYSEMFGNTLCKLAEDNEKIVAITAAMPSGCGLNSFASKFPERFFDVGIAEQHAVTMGAGLAISGITPVVCVYSTFLQRAYDQILHDVCLQNLHVVFAVDRAGIVGEDGETHQGIFDFSYMLHIPNITILAPSCDKEFDTMLTWATNVCNTPVSIRYPRGKVVKRESSPFEISKAEVLKTGKDITIVTVGNMVDICLDVSAMLDKNGIDAEVINLRTVKPFDRDTVFESLEKTHYLITVEDNMKTGGMGEYVYCEYGKPIKAIHFGYDGFIPHGSPEELYEIYNMSSERITERILREWQNIAKQA